MHGHWIRKSAETSDRKAALAKEKEYRAKFIDERKGLRKDITIGKAVDGFVKSKEGTANHGNVERDGVVVKQFLCASTDLQDVSTADVTRFVAHLKKKKYANSTIKHRLQTLRSSIAFAKSHGFIIPEVDYPKLKLTKGRTRILSQEELQAIENELNPDKKGGPRGYTGGAIRKAIKRAGLGPEVTPHVIRHTIATRLLEAGLNIMDVQNILGHAEMSTTRRYLHTSAQDAAFKARDALNDLNRQGTEPKLQIVGGKE
jgi:site-specific recombinase XerD